MVPARLQGSPAITAWCHVCEYRAVPILDGICGFCDTPIAGLALERATGVRAERARIRKRDYPAMPAGQTCDYCEQPATVRMQGETDSFGAEWLDFCDHHAARVRAGATFGYCVECDALFELPDPDVELPRCPEHAR